MLHFNMQNSQMWIAISQNKDIGIVIDIFKQDFVQLQSIWSFRKCDILMFHIKHIVIPSVVRQSRV